jgi:ComF family protein
MRSAGWRTLDLILPGECPTCGAPCANLSQSSLCEECEVFWDSPVLRCQACAIRLDRRGPPIEARSIDLCCCDLDSGDLADGKKLDGIAGPGLICRTCQVLPPSFDATLTLACYNAPLDRLAIDLKFRRRVALARDFAKRLADLVRSGEIEPVDLIVPIPLSSRRLAQRGYNQAWQIARPLAKRLGIAADARMLLRVIDTPPQSGLDLAARTRNLHRAFAVVKSVAGLHVAVVDDVMTSGITLESAAAMLKTAGARRVTNLVVFRTPAPGS